MTGARVETEGLLVRECRSCTAQGQEVKSGHGVGGERLSQTHPRCPKVTGDPARFVNRSFLLIIC